MQLTSCLHVQDAVGFLDMFADVAGAVPQWELQCIELDLGGQFVYVKYVGEEFAGQGLRATVFAASNDPTLLRLMIDAEG